MSQVMVFEMFFKDIFYATVFLGVFYLTHFETSWLFFLHATSWISCILYTVSSQQDFWVPTFAIVLTLGTVCLDCFIFLTTICYLHPIKCCLPGHITSPMSITFPVCGPTKRYESDSFLIAALCVIFLAIVVGLRRANLMFDTKRAASIETALCTLYLGLKIYPLMWSGVSYTVYFYAQSALSMFANVIALFASFRFRLVSTLIFAGVILLDLLVVLGATRAIDFFESRPSGPSPTGRRSLLMQADYPNPVPEFPVLQHRDALTAAANVLSLLPAGLPAVAATAAIAQVTQLMATFTGSVQTTCLAAHAQANAFTCGEALSEAVVATRVLEATACCEEGTQFTSTISNLDALLVNLNENWDSMWRKETNGFTMQVQTGSLIQTRLLWSP